MQIQSSIKNIIFDFGGVILNIDYTLTERAFAGLGLTDFHKIYSQATQKDLFDRLETGKISPAAFRAEIRKYIGEATDAQIDKAWNAMLLDLPAERVALLDRLRATHRIFLLSNTNEIHYKAFTAYMKETFKRDIFSEVFEKAYVSHKIKMRKPDAEVFEFVLRENGLNKDETLFIDDSIQHIEGAKKVGLNALFLEKGKTILDVFQTTI